MKAEDWIKVSDRLPKYEETVLCCGYWRGLEDMECYFRHRTERKDVLVDDNGFAIIDGMKITHWMPIILPKEE